MLLVAEDFNSPIGYISDDRYLDVDPYSWVTVSGEGICVDINENSTDYIRMTMDDDLAVVGARVYFQDWQNHSERWLQFRDENNALICAVNFDAPGNLTVYDANGSLASTVVSNMLIGNWYNLEFKLSTNTGGSDSLVIRKDGTVLSTVNADFTASGTIINTVGFENVGGSGWDNDEYRVSWVYLCDGTGTSNTDFLGSLEIDYLLPDGNGNSSGLTGSDGNSTDNYLLVDEDPLDTADYVEGSTEGDKDTYTYPATSFTDNFAAVIVCPYLELPDGGARYVRGVARVGTTDYTTGSMNVRINTGNSLLFEVNPATGSAWTQAEIDAAEFGLEVRDS